MAANEPISIGQQKKCDDKHKVVAELETLTGSGSGSSSSSSSSSGSGSGTQGSEVAAAAVRSSDSGIGEGDDLSTTGISLEKVQQLHSLYVESAQSVIPEMLTFIQSHMAEMSKTADGCAVVCKASETL